MSYPITYGGVLIIAAGESKRLGTPKQLLSYQGQTLIDRLIGIVQKAVRFPITLVLGAHAESIRAQLKHTELSIVTNQDWKSGMAGSIRVGLMHVLKEYPGIDGLLILVCDQPFITEMNIRALIDLQRTTSFPIAACYYAQVIGTPALFHESIFPELLKLEGDVGAKKIIQQREAEVAKLHFEQGMIDIDTIDDYELLLKAGSIQ